jgi:propanol-preferring alcohol dehydrogenase
MRAQVLEHLSYLSRESQPLTLRDLPDPSPGPGEVLLEVLACGVCHTELDEIEGRTPPPRLPVIPGHQVVGRVIARGTGAEKISLGERVGVAWIFTACGHCSSCYEGRENLCKSFRATGRDANGGYAQLMAVAEAFVHPIPRHIPDAQAAPLLCAGAVGYRALRLAALHDGQNLGLTGFGASAHLVLQTARHLYPNGHIFVFARSPKEQEFARDLGADWAGDTMADPPEALDAIIDSTPAWKPLVAALMRLKPGGRLVVNAIRKENADKVALLDIDYPTHLWREKSIISVANVTREDVREFLALAACIPIQPEVQLYPLSAANQALREIKEQKIRGAKVLLTQEV